MELLRALPPEPTPGLSLKLLGAYNTFQNPAGILFPSGCTTPKFLPTPLPLLMLYSASPSLVLIPHHCCTASLLLHNLTSTAQRMNLEFILKKNIHPKPILSLFNQMQLANSWNSEAQTSPFFFRILIVSCLIVAFPPNFYVLKKAQLTQLKCTMCLLQC